MNPQRDGDEERGAYTDMLGYRGRPCAMLFSHRLQQSDMTCALHIAGAEALK